MRRLVGLTVGCALASVSAAALAGEGYTVATTTLYSAPDPGYPPVDTIPAGARVFVEGCTDGYVWCDVIAGEGRGWMPGNYIQYDYNGQFGFVSAFGAAIGIPIVAFSIGDYWGRYYRGRPFWAQHDRWFARPMPHRPAPVYRGPVRDYVHGPVRELVGHPYAHAPMGHPVVQHRAAPAPHVQQPVHNATQPHAQPQAHHAAQPRAQEHHEDHH
ncbi:MAG: SH3 domain-containing protein [Rudaea sp.]|uniref:SH3 domain-containing protein n=1 Tax=Rudaea sp. TaxID=2136325 RepID=UPI0039E46F0C